MTKTIDQQAVLSAILRTDFKAFVRKVFEEVSGADEFKDNWHIDAVCSFLTDMRDGEFNRGIINIPPRCLKSIICSVALPAWLLGLNPKTRIICASYSDDFALKLASDCKRIIQSPWYQEVFPNTSLTKTATGDFETISNGGRFTASISGGVTGRGADWIIVDDPLKPQDAMSDSMREKVNEWYRSTLLSRLNNKTDGKILLIMQRLHEDDLSGYILSTDASFRCVRLPMISEADELIRINPMSSEQAKYIVRKVGGLLHSERDDQAIVDKLRFDLGEYAFSAQYQQNPTPFGGCMVKKDKMHWYPAPITTGFSKIILSWDTASKVTSDAAYSSCVTIGVSQQNKNMYVLDCFRARLDFPALVSAAIDMRDKAMENYNCRNADIIIEDASSGTQLLQELKGRGITAVPITAGKSKEVRFAGITPRIESGECLFPAYNPVWWFEFEKELLAFPSCKYKDQCDALSQGVEYTKNIVLNKVIKHRNCVLTFQDIGQNMGAIREYSDCHGFFRAN
jgi:predicted phage terminase large subunit-like protein